MGTKRHPGLHDCYTRAQEDEPMFTLLARDKSAPYVILKWVIDRIETGKNRWDDSQIVGALACAQAMKDWKKGPVETQSPEAYGMPAYGKIVEPEKPYMKGYLDGWKAASKGFNPEESK